MSNPQWWYISFAIPGRFLGGVVIGPARDIADAVRLTYAHGIDPSPSGEPFEASGYPVTTESVVPIPARNLFRLLSKSDVAAMRGHPSTWP